MAQTIRCISPIDGSVYAERPTLDAETAFFEVTRARAAQAEWAARPLAERIALVRDGVARVGAR
jgi:acyl-CoA reductase-like NAD-dependent aldehyde dehydrogenase